MISVLSAIVAVVAFLLPFAARAAPAHEALVVGNGTYTTMPSLPGCLLSAHSVAAALRSLGFGVIEKEDATSGGTDAAISEFSHRIAAASGASGVVYICGYATSYVDRPFILPVSANMTRPADVLTQGVLAKSVLDTVTKNGIGAALFVLDLTVPPGADANLGLSSLTQTALPDALGLIAVSQPRPLNTVTPLAAALVADLKNPQIQVGPLLADLQRQLAGNAASVGAFRAPVATASLAGAPVAVAASPAPQAGAPNAALPADDQMTEADRRRVQSALTKLGYYDGKVDGIFGPDTRAAIRRYQHEIGAAMTGKLTAEQASKLGGGS